MDPSIVALFGGAQATPSAPAAASASPAPAAPSNGMDPSVATLFSKAGAGDSESYSPTGSFLDNLAAGSGAMVADVGLGARELAAKLTGDRDWQSALEQEAAEKRATDAPLLKSWGGWLGHTGTALLPAAIPGVGSVAGAAALGAGMGALTPTTAGESTLANTVLSGALGAGSGFVGNRLGSWLATRAGAAARVLTPAQQEAAAGGADLGMKLTPGQSAGSRSLQQLEAKLSSQPWTSAPFTRVASANQSALDKAAARAVGEDTETLDSTALARASDRLSDTFENIRSSARPVSVDPQQTAGALNAVDDRFRGLLPGDMSIRDNSLVSQLDRMVSGTAPKADAVPSFLKDFENANPANPAEPTERLVNGNVRVELTGDPVNPGTVHVASIQALKPGMGDGTQALNSLTQLADRHGVTLTLDAQPLDSTVSPAKLADWYRQRGFNPAATDATPALMERAPAGSQVTAQQLGQLSSKLGQAAFKQMTGASGDRDLGRALYAVKDHVDGLVQSALSPAEAADYAAARTQYRNLMLLTSRANIVNPSTGHVSGTALAGKLQQADRQGFLFGRNQTPMYQAARFAQAFKPIVGDSGTATRSGGHGVASGLALGGLGALMEGPHGLALAAVPMAARALAGLGSRAYLTRPGAALARGVTALPGMVSRGSAATSRFAAPGVRWLVPRAAATLPVPTQSVAPWMQQQAVGQ